MGFGLHCHIVHQYRVGVQLLHHVAHQASTTQQVSTELFDELLETCLALSTSGILMGLGNRRADRQEVCTWRYAGNGCSHISPLCCTRGGSVVETTRRAIHAPRAVPLNQVTVQVHKP